MPDNFFINTGDNVWIDTDDNKFLPPRFTADINDNTQAQTSDVLPVLSQHYVLPAPASRAVVINILDVVERLDPERHEPVEIYRFSNGRKFVKAEGTEYL